MFDPNQLYTKLDLAVDEYAKATQEFKTLDYGRKSLLASITLQCDGKSQSERETKALASEEYQEYCKGLAQAEMAYIKAKFKVANIQNFIENTRTLEVSNRNATK